MAHWQGPVWSACVQASLIAWYDVQDTVQEQLWAGEPWVGHACGSQDPLRAA